jgi:signal transduction histidine kinase
MEIKDDTKQTFDEAIGLSTYSTSKAGVLSLVSIFENFWIQAELYREVKEANKNLELAIDELKLREEMQRDFINIAAHELRNPIQPIIGLTQILRSTRSEGRTDRDKFLIDTIIRNALRLKHVAENLLDVSRIENETLRLNKEIIDIDELISSTVQDFATELKKGGNKSNAAGGGLNLSYQNLGQIFVEADKHRLGQVISNLLNNAIASTGVSGGITVKATTNKLEKDNNKEFIIITVRDSGRGIAPDMFPKLFSKFATKSEFGTGLGLYISKNIIESHGGKIWAQNNEDKIGATFAFSLPIHDPRKTGASF